MGEMIKLDIQLRAFVRRETRSRWLEVCTKINVATQGKTETEAKRCLDEAVELWFEDCIERGTLQEALRECGFRTATREEADASPEHILVSREAEPDVLEDLFSVPVPIPPHHPAAYMPAAQHPL